MRTADNRGKTAMNNGTIGNQEIRSGAVDESMLSMLVGGGFFATLCNNPLRSIALKVKNELTAFVARHRRVGSECGSHARDKILEVEAAPLQEKLENLAAKLDHYISGKGAFTQHVEVRVMAVNFQAALEIFALSLEPAVEEGRLPARQLANLLRAAIELKAEVNTVLLNLESVQLRLAEACQNSTS